MIKQFEISDSWVQVTNPGEFGQGYIKDIKGIGTLYVLSNNELPDDSMITLAREFTSKKEKIDLFDDCSGDVYYLRSTTPMKVNLKLNNITFGDDFLLRVSMGLVPGFSSVDKFGENPVIDTNTTPEDIVEFGGEYIYDDNGTAPIKYISSSSTLDVGQIINVVGLDINGVEVSQEVTTNGQNNVSLSTPLWRVYRMNNNSPSGNDLNGILYCHIDPSPSSGVPAAGNIRAIIDNGNNQTLMSVYTIPVGKVGFLFRGELGMSRSTSSGAVQAAYYSRRYGKNFNIKKRVNITNSGNSIYQDRRAFPDIVPGLTDIKLRVESVSANNIGVFGTFDVLLADEDKFTESYLELIEQPTI